MREQIMQERIRQDRASEEEMPYIASANAFVNRVYPFLLTFLTGVLIFVLCLWMFAGIVNITLDLLQNFRQGWGKAVEHMIVHALLILALLEVIRTLQSYIKLGRVRVTFILDTALVVLIGELMGLWFREYTWEKVVLSLAVIVTLVALRIGTSRFSPDSATI